jgi:DNA-binding MarR family transcriptional regulator
MLKQIKSKCIWKNIKFYTMALSLIDLIIFKDALIGEVVMDEYFKELNLIDLISEKHKKLRGKVMKLWSEKKGEEITDTEAHMLAMLEIKSLTIAESARKVKVTRQAAHKCVKKLIDRGYVVLSSIEGNNRDKLIVLTPKGKEYCMEMLKIKEEIEEEIATKIGRENVELLKKYFRESWIEG